MNVLLFILIVFVSFIAVRIGAIAFELTGLEWSFAKFQALSCFTGTGFTTKESELITSNPSRRKIASFLIIIGHAGFVTLIATFANSLRPSSFMNGDIPFIKLNLPQFLVPIINVMLIFIIIFIFYKIFTSNRILSGLTKSLKKYLQKGKFFRRVSFEELLVSTGGYGISRIEITKHNPFLGKTISDAKLREIDINVLVIERDNKRFPNPKPSTEITIKDKIICFGKLEDISSKFNLQ